MITLQKIFTTSRGEDFIPPKRLLALDPGETTGWALFVDGVLEDWGQHSTSKEGKASLLSFLQRISPTALVFENYRVYGHKLKQHTGSEVFTARAIGVIELFCEMEDITPGKLMAHEHKAFVTDKKLKEWDLWKKGQRHARDAIRIGLFYLLFRYKKPDSKKTK